MLRVAPQLLAVGEERLVDDDQTVRWGNVRYSTPDGHRDRKLWCRVVGDELAITAATDLGLVEVARHRLSTPGSPRINAARYPHHPSGNLPRPPRL